MTDRPLIAIDVKLKHLQDLNTGELVLPEAYETEFAFRDRYQVFNRYVDAVYEHGGMPLMVPPIVDEDLLAEYVEMADAFLCVGVNDYPPEIYREPVLEANVQDNDGYRRLSEANMIVTRLVLQEDDRMPALGICAGPQAFNIALGGKLVQHIPNAENHIAHTATRDRYHGIEVVEGSIMARLFGAGRIDVNSNHHQAPHPDHIGEGLWATAFSDDGVVEAIECREPDRFVLGVQWHPERIRDMEHQEKVFGSFIKAAREYRDGS